MLRSTLNVRRVDRTGAGLPHIPRAGHPPRILQRHRARVAAVGLVLGLVVGLVQLGAPLAARGADGYTLGSDSSYVMNVAAGRVEVTITIHLKNTTPNKGTARYYFDTVDVAVEDGATSLAARADAGTATIRR